MSEMIHPQIPAKVRPTTVNGFHDSMAVVIGIDGCANGIPRLKTAANDAMRLAQLLEVEHGYRVHCVTEDVSKARLRTLFQHELRGNINIDDRLLVYFAGHGIALDGDDGPEGFLVPQDANPANRDSLFPMSEFHGWLAHLPCRHLLVVLDCCFAGAFRCHRQTPGLWPLQKHDKGEYIFLISHVTTRDLHLAGSTASASDSPPLASTLCRTWYLA